MRATMDRPKKKPVPRRAVSLKLPEALMLQWEKLLDQTGRTNTKEVCMAMEAHLRKFKLWPPKSDPDGT